MQCSQGQVTSSPKLRGELDVLEDRGGYVSGTECGETGKVLGGPSMCAWSVETKSWRFLKAEA